MSEEGKDKVCMTYKEHLKENKLVFIGVFAVIIPLVIFLIVVITMHPQTDGNETVVYIVGGILISLMIFSIMLISEYQEYVKKKRESLN